jgi:hypothetical protein
MQFLVAFAKLQKGTISFVTTLSVCMEQRGSHWMDFHETWYISNVQKSVQKTKISLKSDTKIMGTLHEDQYAFFIFHSIVLRMRTRSHKCCREKINTHTAHSKPFFFKSCPLWDNVANYFTAGQATDDNTTKHIAGCTPKATDTNSGYVILIALPLQQWLYECTSMLCCTCISCLVNSQWHHKMYGYKGGHISSSHCHHEPCISHVTITKNFAMLENFGHYLCETT